MQSITRKKMEKQNLIKYKETLTSPLRQATLCFLLKDNQILLAMKKRGFAEGKWNGAGGKPANIDKDIEATAIRETFEEIGVIPKSLQQMAVLNFYFLDKSEWSQQVIVYTTKKWMGNPSESEEMAPKWFDINEIPYDQMWEDDKFWLPQILKGIKIEANFLFNKEQKMLEKDVKETK